MNEITNNGSLLKELRALDFVRWLINEGKLDADGHRKMHVHAIENQDVLMPMGASSEMKSEWLYLTHLLGERGPRNRGWVDKG